MVTNTTRAFGSPLRYLQGPGEFGNLAEYTAPYGSACILIDGFLYADLRARLDAIYENRPFLGIAFRGECCEPEVERISDLAKANAVSVFVGVGGGKTLDTAKLCADTLNLPVIIVPSAASTDAPVSEIAVLYREDGEYAGSRKLRRNADLVLVDSEIIVKAPKRLFAAGMGDALATWLEARACAASDSPNYIGRKRRCLTGMAIAKACWDTLFADGRKALMALDSGVVTEALENVIEANTLMSGLGFLNTGLSTAHGIHSGLTAIPSTHKYLHGEKVAFGIVCQAVLENLPEEEANRVMRFLVETGLPVTLAQLGVEPTAENIAAIAAKTAEGPLVHHEPSVVTERMLRDVIKAADALGKKALQTWASVLSESGKP